MISKIAKRLTLGGILLASGFLATSQRLGNSISVAHADATCSSMLQGYVDYANGTLPGSQYPVVAVTMTTIQQGRLVSYATADLDLVNGQFTTTSRPGGWGPGQEALQQFSDRTRSYGDYFGYTQNFDTLSKDNLGITIDPSSGTTTLTLDSWGGGQMHVRNPQCANGVMYGFADGSLGNGPAPTFMTFTFANDVGYVTRTPR